jgi:hypothetical protein
MNCDLRESSQAVDVVLVYRYEHGDPRIPNNKYDFDSRFYSNLLPKMTNKMKACFYFINQLIQKKVEIRFEVISLTTLQLI